MDVTTLVYLIAPFIPLVIGYLYRKRLVAWFSKQLAQSIISWAFVTEAGKGGVVEIRGVSDAARGLLAAAAPALIQEGVKSFKVNLPKFAPVNPATGQLDFMAPILAKAMDGKKLGLNDFLPLIMEKAMPFVQGFLGGAVKPKEAEAPKLPFP